MDECVFKESCRKMLPAITTSCDIQHNADSNDILKADRQAMAAKAKSLMNLLE